ncbi:hypothetical protein [Halorubrum salinum]|uniref:hypothetical protein n=1 Tax=Halorubrum salinum TaxID=767517 RepID=UPI0021134077|nr:hypothetical protein [Halorubrum salinum]
MAEVTSAGKILLITAFAAGASIVPAFAIMNRFIREKESNWSTNRGIGVMIIAGLLFSGMLTVNGIANTSYALLSTEALVSLLMMLVGSFIGMVVIGAFLAYPLHWFLQWQEPPDVVKEFQP